MHALVFAVFFLVGLRLLWRALKAKAFHYPMLGVNRDGPPMPVLYGRLMAALLGVFFVVLAVWGFAKSR